MRDQLRLRIGEIQKTSAAIAAVDVLAAFAQPGKKMDHLNKAESCHVAPECDLKSELKEKEREID